MQEEIKILIEDILEQNFKNSLSGYSKDEVDTFLDNIIEFLKKLLKNIKESDGYIDQVNKTNLDMKLVITKLEEKLRSQSDSIGMDGLVIKRRISDIEKQINDLKKDLEY